MSTLLHLPFDSESGIGNLFDYGVLGISFAQVLNSSTSSLTFKSGKYGAAAYFTGAYLIAPYVPAFYFGAGDFTIEGWLYWNGPAGTSQSVICQWADGGTAGWRVGINTSGEVFFDYRTTSGSTNPSKGAGTGRLSTGVWTHFAVVRASGMLSIYLGGVLSVSYSLADLYASTDSINIGRSEQNNTWYYSGYLDDLRISNTALYTAAFTPPNAIAYTKTFNLALTPEPLSLSGGRFPDPGPAIMDTRVTTYDLYFGGSGTITGTTKVKSSPSNLPVSRRVRLYEKRSGMLIREIWSNSTGAYTFKYLNTDYTYYVTAFDHTNTYEAVASDNLVPTT